MWRSEAMSIGAKLTDLEIMVDQKSANSRVKNPSLSQNSSIGRIFGNALFLDRDGTLIVHRPYLCEPEKVELLPGVRDTMHRLVKDGFQLFLFTNQSGVGRGWFTIEDVDRCNRRMMELMELPLTVFSGICVAPELPNSPSKYRKPSPRFILEMMTKYQLQADRTVMIGDARSDIEAGLNAGVQAVLLEGQSVPEVPAKVQRCRGLWDLYSQLSFESR